jgi:hypothetical protein
MPHKGTPIRYGQKTPRAESSARREKFRSAAYVFICKQEIFSTTQQLGYNGVAVKAKLQVMPKPKSGFLFR